MADDRKLYPQAFRDRKVASLTDLEFRVWVTYLLSANDLGVLPWSASVLQGANTAIDEPRVRRRDVEAAMATLTQPDGLLLTFEHDGQTYAWSRKWQDWQNIRYPRRTPWPVPQDVSEASELTRQLFARYAEQQRKAAEKARESSDRSAEEFPKNFGNVPTSRVARARAYARNPNPYPSTNPSTNPATDVPGTPVETAHPDREGGPGGSARNSDAPVEVSAAASVRDRDETVDTSGSARALTPVWSRDRTRPRGLGAGDAYHRLNCPSWGLAACAVGCCIPRFLQVQWVQRQSEDALKAFVEKWAPQVKGDRPERFWPAAFEREFGRGAPDESPVRPAPVAERVAARLRGQVGGGHA